jgi:hypothetical protein
MKKSSSAIGRTTLTSGPASKKNMSAIDDIHKKIVSSPALNGGFDTLLYKIDKIEQSQGHLVSKLDKIHDAIYDPQDGLFSKMSQQKLENEIKLGEINQNVLELKLWKNHKDKSDQKEEDEIDKSKGKIASLEKTVETLNENKNTIWSITKWLAAALGGAIVTILLAYLRKKLSL